MFERDLRSGRSKDCDGNGVNHDDKFWITLLELPPVDDYEPQNRVRPASLFTPEGTRIDAGVEMFPNASSASLTTPEAGSAASAASSSTA